MSTFADLGIEARLCDALTRAGIDAPFPIQELTLVDALAGRDVCGKAPTGSGKTLAYGLAILQRVERSRPRSPRALVLVPTRELAGQVATALAPYGQARQRWVTAFFGGAGMMRQISDLKRGVDVAVATPGRLTDLVNRGECNLGDVELIVIDEADRMADMGFTPQVSWLLDRVNENRQILLFSATLDGDVDQLIKKYLKDPVHHEMASPTGEDEDTSVLQRAKHFSTLTKNDTKFQDISFVADGAERSIIFVKNRFATERTAAALETLGVSALAMHGGMTQSARSKALQRWADGKVKALVATDVAARGVHVDGVELVIHVDPPQDHKDYLHRSGRTARAGAQGVVVNLLRKEQKRSSAAMFARLGVEVIDGTPDDIRDLLKEYRATAAEQRLLNPPPASRATALGDWVSEDDPYIELNGRPRAYGDRGGSRSGGGFDRGRSGPPRSGGSRGSAPFGNNDRGGPRRDGGRFDEPRRDRYTSDRSDSRPSDRFAPAARGGYGDRLGSDRSAESNDRPTYAPRNDRGDRPGSAPRGDRPAYAPRGDRPAYATRGDRSAFAPRGDRPAYASRNDRGDRGDRPAYVRDGRPDGAPGGDRSGNDRPGNDRPAWRSEGPGRSDRFESRDRGGFDRSAPREGGRFESRDRGPAREGGFAPRGDRYAGSTGRPAGAGYGARNSAPREGGFAPRDRFAGASGGGDRFGARDRFAGGSDSRPGSRDRFARRDEGGAAPGARPWSGARSGGGAPGTKPWVRREDSAPGRPSRPVSAGRGTATRPFRDGSAPSRSWSDRDSSPSRGPAGDTRPSSTKKAWSNKPR